MLNDPKKTDDAMTETLLTMERRLAENAWYINKLRNWIIREIRKRHSHVIVGVSRSVSQGLQ
jgi:3-methyladenine DNA glycosylase AlkD